MIGSQRIEREIQRIQSPSVIGILQHENEMNLIDFTMEVCKKVFTIQFDFPKEYPFHPPRICFLTPVHLRCVDPTNGQICLTNLCYMNWSPAILITHILDDIQEELEKYLDRRAF